MFILYLYSLTCCFLIRSKNHFWSNYDSILFLRKLTGTALIVTLVSLLCLLSVMIYGVCLHFSSTCLRNVHMDMGVVVLFLANSLVNPIIYAVRMPGFREGLLQIGYRVPDLSRIAPANLPLRNLRRA